MIKKIFLIFIVLYSFNSITAEKNPLKNVKSTDGMDEDPALEFKDTKYLQVERISLPDELKKIEEQIRQNVIDVVLISKTHIPVYSQRREEYNENYKKFFGIQLNITPIPGNSDSYEVGIFYYNWTTNKFDRKFYKRISKFNVLNEMRFGIYELLFGKDYIKKNRDAIDIQNYERIQSVRKSIDEMKKIEKKNRLKEESDKLLKDIETEKKKKNKLKREEKESQVKNSATDEEDKNNAEDNDGKRNSETQNDLSRTEELENSKLKLENVENNNSRKKKNNKKDEVKNIQNNGNIENKVPQIDNTPGTGNVMKYNSNLMGLIGPAYDYSSSITSDNRVKVNSNFRYFCIGGHLDIIQDRIEPIGYNVRFKVGMPFIKQGYAVPLFKSLDFTMDKYDFLISGMKYSAGLQYSPINFVNVPDFGEGNQVFENNFIWAKFGIQYNANIKGKDFRNAINYYLSAVTNSSQKKKFSGAKLEFLSSLMLDSKFGVELLVQQAQLIGDLTVNFQSAHVQMVYKFEN